MQKTKILSRISIGITTMLMSVLSSCITTVEDVIGQYDFQGPIDFAQWYADDFSNDSLWNKAINDSILPRFMALPFDDIVQIGSIIKETPAFVQMSSISIDRNKIMESFKNRGFSDGVDFYLRYHSLFVGVDSVFIDSILPLVKSAPYPVIRDVRNRLKEVDIDLTSDSLFATLKANYLSDIKEEMYECKMKTMEAFDQVVVPAIEFEIDSLSEKSIRTIIDKFSGGFLDYRRIMVALGRDGQKFKELWAENIDGNDYTEIYFRHTSTMLKDMYNLQSEYYRAYTNSDLQLDIKMVEPSPILIKFPETEMTHINEFIENERFWGTVDAVDILPNLPSADPKILALQAIFETGRFIFDICSVISNDEMSPDDKLVAYCQFSIISQISENYKNNLRNQVLAIIDQSYNNLYTNIENAI